MAEVDLTNAVLEPAIWSVPGADYLGLTKSGSNYVFIVNSNAQRITSSDSSQVLVNEKYKLVVAVEGTFNTSGTEFYLSQRLGSVNYIHWRIRNVTFQSGDTVHFQVSANLTMG